MALTASELYLNCSAREVHDLDVLVDDCSGFYAVYWTRHEGRLLASTHAAALVQARGRHVPNKARKPFPASRRPNEV